ncbi:M24 family metallopeptidase [Candidatus Palauibacter sp.]|uniref:M24 family metallopeptidase n=1 Tax=Candidatus Palauibacter sp. TaxID=3101350 RepID=UPI003C7014E1
MSAHEARRLRLAATAGAAGHGSVLVTARSSVRYLSGFTGSAGVLWVPVEGAPTLVTDSRYEEQVRLEVEDSVPAHITRGGWIRGVADVAAGARGPTSFEAESLTVAEYEALREGLPGMAFVSCRDLVRELRQVKDEEELRAIERAVAVAESAFDRLLAAIDWSAAPSERRVATALEAELRRGGSGPLPFDPIVAAGERSALPHATPSERRIEAGDLLLLDFGARVDGYCSDMTRTCVRGVPEPWQVTIHERVLEAQARARETIRAGASCRAVDAAARDALARHDLDDRFGHSTGHGIGLDIHEGPSLSARSDETLRAGNVVTVEPGVYLPGRGGVRIEDDVLVEASGARTLTRLPRALVEL